MQTSAPSPKLLLEVYKFLVENSGRKMPLSAADVEVLDVGISILTQILEQHGMTPPSGLLTRGRRLLQFSGFLEGDPPFGANYTEKEVAESQKTYSAAIQVLRNIRSGKQVSKIPPKKYQATVELFENLTDYAFKRVESRALDESDLKFPSFL